MKYLQLKILNTRLSRGFSLIEMLIVVGIFSVLAIIITQTLAASLRGSRKSENLGIVRENVEYAMNFIERSLRSATKLDFDDSGAGDVCDGSALYFYNNNGESENFTYVADPGFAIAYNGSNITSSSVRVTAFNVNCLRGLSGEPDSVTISITANDALTTSSAESATYTGSTTISLRNYSRN